MVLAMSKIIFQITMNRNFTLSIGAINVLLTIPAIPPDTKLFAKE